MITIRLFYSNGVAESTYDVKEPQVEAYSPELADCRSIYALDVTIMDKKDKKKLEPLNKKLQLLKQRLAGEKRDRDDPSSIPLLEKEIAQLEEQIRKLKE